MSITGCREASRVSLERYSVSCATQHIPYCARQPLLRPNAAALRGLRKRSSKYTVALFGVRIRLLDTAALYSDRDIFRLQAILLSCQMLMLLVKFSFAGVVADRRCLIK